MIKIKGVVKDLSSKIDSKESKNTTVDQNYDEVILQRLQIPGLKFGEITELISLLKNDAIKEEQMKQMLGDLYNFDTDTSKFLYLEKENEPNDDDIMTVLSYAEITMNSFSEEAIDLVKKIISKKIAINYKRDGHITINAFKRLDGISSNDLVDTIVVEYAKLYPDEKLDPAVIIEQIQEELKEKQEAYFEKFDSSIKKMRDEDGLDILRMMTNMADDMAEDPSLINPMNDFYQAVSIIPDKDKKKAITACADTINERFATKDREVQLMD